MSTTFNNGRVAISKDMIFGLCVFGELPDGKQQWLPLTSLDKEDLDWVVKMLDHNPTFPWYPELRKIIEAAKEKQD